MPRMNERDRRTAIESQITALLDQATDPCLNDSTGLINILRAQLVAEMMAKHERVKAAWDSALAALVAVLEQRIQDLKTELQWYNKPEFKDEVLSMEPEQR